MIRSIAEAIVEAKCLDRFSSSWRLDGELIVAKALGQRREWVIAHSTDKLEPRVLEAYRVDLERRLNGEPIAYILGSKEFWGLKLKVTPEVLIPRPETEMLVDTALGLFEGSNEAVNVADLGTGSGAIAIALAHDRPGWQLAAVDASAEALAIARENAATHAVSNVEFMQGSWCEPLIGRKFDMIISNPPYVAANDEHLFYDGLSFEPRLALVSDDDGLADLNRIIDQSRKHLRAGGWLLLEHGYDQGEAVTTRCEEAGYSDIRCVRDFGENDRMTRARWPGDGEQSR